MHPLYFLRPFAKSRLFHRWTSWRDASNHSAHRSPSPPPLPPSEPHQIASQHHARPHGPHGHSQRGQSASENLPAGALTSAAHSAAATGDGLSTRGAIVALDIGSPQDQQALQPHLNASGTRGGVPGAAAAATTHAGGGVVAAARAARGVFVRGLHKSFASLHGQRVRALDGADLRVAPGSITALLGHNGYVHVRCPCLCQGGG